MKRKYKLFIGFIAAGHISEATSLHRVCQSALEHKALWRRSMSDKYVITMKGLGIIEELYEPDTKQILDLMRNRRYNQNYLGVSPLPKIKAAGENRTFKPHYIKEGGAFHRCYSASP